jgi:hypothetical protein
MNEGPRMRSMDWESMGMTPLPIGHGEGSAASESEILPIGKKGVFPGKESYSIPGTNHVILGHGPVVDHG